MIYVKNINDTNHAREKTYDMKIRSFDTEFHYGSFLYFLYSMNIRFIV